MDHVLSANAFARDPWIHPNVSSSDEILFVECSVMNALLQT
jgi:hypothetical protein